MRRMDSVSAEMRSKTYCVFWPSTAVVKCASTLIVELKVMLILTKMVQIKSTTSSVEKW